MKRIHSKDDIVQAGLEIMLSKGFNATGVDSILKQANVPRGSFYNFFASKEEFGLAIIDRYSAKIGEILNLFSMMNRYHRLNVSGKVSKS